MTLTLHPLRSDLETSEQIRAGKVEVVVRDPVNGNVYSFSKNAFSLLKEIEGEQQMHSFVAARDADDPNLRDKIYVLLKRAIQCGLLSNGTGPLPALERRFRFGMWVISEVSLRPIAPKVTLVFGSLFKWMAVPAALFVLAGLATIAQKAQVFAELLPQVLPSYSWWWLMVPLMIASLAWHETGHMVAASRFGARQIRGGIALYMLMPAAFVKVEDYQLISSARQRTLVALGGLWFDILLFVSSALAWAFTEPFAIANQTAYLVSLFVLFRILINVVPFFGLDGYRALSEVIGIRKLREHAYHNLLAGIPPLRPWLKDVPRPKRAVAAALMGYAVSHLVFMGLLLWWTYVLFSTVFAVFAGPLWSKIIAGTAVLVNVAALGTQLARDLRPLLRIGDAK
jgi:hypothetical protein